MQLPERVTITEVGPRDGLQNEDAHLGIERKVELINRLGSTGVTRIEAASFVSPKAIPQMADASEVMQTIRRRPRVTYIALVPNEVGARNAINAGADELATVVSASETHNRRNVNRTVEDSLAGIAVIAELAKNAGISWSGYISTAFGCPYEGDVPQHRVMELAERLHLLGASQIALGDTIGCANPRQVDDLIGAFRARLPAVPLRMHFHDTRGVGLANVLTALQAGVDSFDSSIGGLGGCPYAPGAAGNVATEDLVYMLDRMRIESGVDLAQAIDVARWTENLIGRSLPGRVKAAGEAVARSAG